MLSNRNMLAALIWACHCGSAAAGDLTIAVVGPMSGRLAEFGAQVRAGVEFAAADINAAGGLRGSKLKVISKDDQCDPAQAVAVAAKFAAAKVPDERVALVVGHFCSRASIPAADVYAKAGIIQITPASSHPRLTMQRAGPTIFRLTGRDDQQGKMAADYLAHHSKSEKVAVVHDNSAFGKSLAQKAQQEMHQAGQSVMSVGALPQTISPLVSQLKVAGTEAVYFGGNFKEAARLLRAMRKQGMTTQLIGSDALATQKFWQATGIAGNGTVMTRLWDPRTSASAKAVVARMDARRIRSDGYVLYAYAAVEAWAQAVKAAGSTQARAVSKKLSDMALSTVLGRFAFDENGDPDQVFYRLYRWSSGRYQPLD